MGNARGYDLPIRECHDPMVSLADYPFVLEPRYFQSGLSETPAMWARKTVADKLLHLQQEELRGMAFKIWDAWRPRSVQQKLYDQCRADLIEAHPDWDADALECEVRKFVAAPDNPQRIPPHATGGAVDLTLVVKNGADLDMGTDFDHFGPESAIDYFDRNDVHPVAAENRKFLHLVMAKGGFTPHIDEWWHFDFGNQRWAAQKGEVHALYGDVLNPADFNRENAKETDHAIPQS